jgi:hypothetical protein
VFKNGTAPSEQQEALEDPESDDDEADVSNTEIENYEPPDEGWAITLGRLREPPGKDEQPEHDNVVNSDDEHGQAE